MTTTATPYLNLPPTFNALDPFQRARFVRTTRKLEHVLGTTPTLLGPSKGAYEGHYLKNDLFLIGPKSNGSGSRSVTSSSSKRQATTSNAKLTRRHGSLFNIPISLNSDANRSSSSLSSMSSQASFTNTSDLRETKGFSASCRRKADTPAPLALFQLNADHVNKADAELGIDAKPPKSPISPFSALSNTFEHRRSRSDSITLSSSSGFGSGVSVPTPLTPSFRHRATAIPAHRRQKLQKLARTLGENVPPSLVFPALSHPVVSDPASGVVRTPKMPTSETPLRASVSRARGGRRRSASAGSLYPLIADARLPLSVSPKNAKGLSRWEPPIDWTVDPKEQEEEDLRGIWSEDDYDSVMFRLRALRK